MLRQEEQKGFTLIELLIVICTIGILAAVAIPIYQNQARRAKFVEVTNAMMQIASAVNKYCEEMAVGGGSIAWPNCPDITSIQSTLGVGIGAVSRISAAQVIQATGVIEATLSNIDPSVDGQTLSLKPTMSSDGSISWVWDGTVPLRYIPTK